MACALCSKYGLILVQVENEKEDLNSSLMQKSF